MPSRTLGFYQPFLTFENIILFSEPEKFLELLDEIKTKGQIDDEQYRKAVNIANNETRKQAEISIFARPLHFGKAHSHGGGLSGAPGHRFS